ncbi:MAG: hypothetical protein VX778_00230 [Candidatus Thermoplasmatota archaeon]|nr:hypothetical protein [Candidatus Thermoplasmatota archaeon]
MLYREALTKNTTYKRLLWLSLKIEADDGEISCGDELRKFVDVQRDGIGHHKSGSSDDLLIGQHVVGAFPFGADGDVSFSHLNRVLQEDLL